MKFAATRSFMTSVIIGATTMDQLERDLAAFDHPWSDEIKDRIEAVHTVRTGP